MKTTLIQGATVVNEGKETIQDVLIVGKIIKKIGKNLDAARADEVVDAQGLYLFPGAIDDQVHFREPGLTHKAEIYTEAKAAVAGGITSFMEMPNTVPQALTQELLEDKYQRAAEVSLANYSFFMGASNHNLDEVLKTDPNNVCGIKVFMGSSTGDMLVDDREVLTNIFKNSPMLVATHCEDEATIRKNIAEYKDKYGEDIPIKCHPEIRNADACYKSSSLAVELAKKYGTRLHILHLSSAKELSLFDNSIPLKDKKITAEVCIHHLWFDDSYYEEKGTSIKWNPAVKSADDREQIFEAMLDNRLDIIATDHAPHTKDEKANKYLKAPSGGPLVQHALVAMLDFYHQGKISLPKIAEKMSHAVATCFDVENRGYIREGYFADLVLVDLNRPWTVDQDNVLYKCGWSPFEGHEFRSSVVSTFVNGNQVYNRGEFDESHQGMRLTFDRS